MQVGEQCKAKSGAPPAAFLGKGESRLGKQQRRLTQEALGL